ncbi:hypothetical protein PG913_08220 [Tenacibaculum pacificus]|uniref:hypothetical protein n=1 Tax=Tenacibaculum pacificus TaxID=3018314 RepID=UPI0022F380F9|nr:hypothetical protein [Tenacibaculum pacificus]WBX72888.1 hypothetical protein PG913_08220 [Tenacibaculum pacificus]
MQVLDNQTLLDIAIQTTGTPLSALLIAKANNLNPSNSLVEGSCILIPLKLIKDQDIYQYYNNNEIIPATALTQTNIDAIIGCEGIGCWAIGIDFKVS